MENIILGDIKKHLKDYAVIGHSHCGFTSGKSCLTNFIFFYTKVIQLVDQGKSTDISFSDFSKDFDTVSHGILLDKVSIIWLDKCLIRQVKKWLVGQAQKVVINGVIAGWWPVSPGFHFRAIFL